MKKLAIAALALVASTAIASAQNIQNPTHVGAAGAYNASPKTCTNGQWCAFQTDINGKLLTSGSVTATIGGFTGDALGTPFTATEAGATGTLPAGIEVVVTNSGPVGAFCNLGNTPSLTGQYISGGGGWFGFLVATATQVSCKTNATTGNTTISMVGGTGIPTGTGGGSGGGGGGGGAITAASGAYASGALAVGSVVDGAIVTMGTLADAAWVSGNGTLVSLLKNMATSNAGQNTNLGSPGAVACTTDTGSCSLNQLLQRIAQRITTLIGSTLTVNLPANAAQETGGNLASIATSNTTQNTNLGAPGATVCATDTGSCSLNALLQRVASRLTTAIGGTAVTVAGGADVVEGTIGDAAYAGSGNATVVSALKGIYAAVVAGGGGGGGGAVTIADGADVTQGALADAAYTGSGNSSVVAALKGVYAVLANNIYTPGTAGTASAQVLTIQGIASMTPVQSVLNAGSALIGKFGIDQTTPGTTNAVALAQINGATTLAGNGVTGTGAQRVTIASDNTAFAVNSQPSPTTSGGLSVYFVQPTASDNHVVIKAGAGQVYKISVTNNSGTVNYLRLYNATTGFNGCNSATNIVYQMAIPANTAGAGYSDSWDLGIAFATGISICVTSGYATTDTTNATASALSVNVGYK